MTINGSSIEPEPDTVVSGVRLRTGLIPHL